MEHCSWNSGNDRTGGPPGEPLLIREEKRSYGRKRKSGMTVRSWRRPCGRFQRPGEGLGRPGGVQPIKGKGRRA